MFLSHAEKQKRSTAKLESKHKKSLHYPSSSMPPTAAQLLHFQTDT